jgi:hypothetical protein
VVLHRIRPFGIWPIIALVSLVAFTDWEAGLAHDRASAPPDRYLVLIVIDGFRPDYMNLAPMPNLHALMQAGTTYSRAWVGQLETQTPAGHASLVTGVYPRKHGVMGFGWRSPTGQSFTWMPTNLPQLEGGEMENLIESGGVPTLSDLMHRRFPAGKSASVSGEKYYAADAMGTGADYILYGKRVGPHQEKGIQATPIGRHVPPAISFYHKADLTGPPYPDVQDQFVARLGIQLLRTLRPRLLLLNLPGTDIEGHLTGGVLERSRMQQVIAGVDKAIGAVVDAYRQVGLYDRTVFVVTADHGMVPSAHIVPIKAMYAAVRAAGAPVLEDDFLSTGGYLYLRNPAQAPEVAAHLGPQHFAGVEGALFKVPGAKQSSCAPEAATGRVLGPNLSRAYVDLCDTIAGADGPDVILPYEEDAMGLTVPHAQHWGNHGGLSWRTQHIPLVMSGPGVRRARLQFPAELVDVAPTLERLLGYPVPSGVDGVVLADALRLASTRDASQQRAVRSGRSSDINALLAHSIRQSGAVVGPRLVSPSVSSHRDPK